MGGIHARWPAVPESGRRHLARPRAHRILRNEHRAARAGRPGPRGGRPPRCVRVLGRRVLCDDVLACVEWPPAGERARRYDQQHDVPTKLDAHGAFSDVASHQAASTLGGATYASRAVYRRVHDSSSGAHIDDDDDDNGRLEEGLGQRDVCATRSRLESSLIVLAFLILNKSQSSRFPIDLYLSLMQARHRLRSIILTLIVWGVHAST